MPVIASGCQAEACQTDSADARWQPLSRGQRSRRLRRIPPAGSSESVVRYR